MRSTGVTELATALPEVVVVLFAAVTLLADTWFVFGLLTLGYWFLPERWCRHPRRSMAVLMALATCTLAAVSLLKHGIAVPRPGGPPAPGSLSDWLAVWFTSATAADGFGFPSGHAAGAAVLYGGLALLLDRPAGRIRLAGFGTVVVAVAISRVVIRVHYLIDVVAGSLLGLSLLYGGLRLAGGGARVFGSGEPRDDDPGLADGGTKVERDSVGEDAETEAAIAEAVEAEAVAVEEPRDPRAALDPTPVFLLAAAVGVAGIVVSTVLGHPEGVSEGGIGVGTALGGAAAWQLVDGDEPAVEPIIAIPGFLIAGAAWLGPIALEPPLVAAIPMAAVGVAVIILLPIAAPRLRTLG